MDPRDLLQRVLLLERQQGFRDRAAVGGLTRFAVGQMERAEPNTKPLIQAAVSALSHYGTLDEASRAAAISHALEALLFGSTVNPDDDSPEDGANGLQGEASGPEEPGPSRLVTIPGGKGASSQSSRVSAQGSEPRAQSSKPPAQSSAPALRLVPRTESLDTPVASLKGMRKTTSDALGKVGVRTVRDALYYFPRAHYDYKDTSSISRMRVGQRTTLVGTVRSSRLNRTARGANITTVVVADDTGTVAVRWFNQPYLKDKFPVGARVAISGEPDVHNGFITFTPREYELIEDADPTHTGRLVPIYPLTKGLYQRSLRTFIRSTLDSFAESLDDYLPDDLLAGLDLLPLSTAVSHYHFPPDEADKTAAERRLAFDELLLIQLGLLMRKQDWQQEFLDVAIGIQEEAHREFLASLPFELTGGQRRVTQEIMSDLQRPVPMSRLLQGDVGSGKTVVAAAALLQTVLAGKQGVLMAPTEILAEQHYRTIQQLLDPFDIKVDLLIGSTPKSQRKNRYEAALDGSAQVIVGTHALIQEGLEFGRLGLAITDEQHRFGVEQRATLRQKGMNAHILFMTATPIPRTLAMTIYGDLDVSSIDEMPPGRTPIITSWARKPVEAYNVVRDEVRLGHQAFVICPVIEESADSDMRSVLAEHRELSTFAFPDLNVGLLHGRMKAAEKEKALQEFRSGSYHILVATSVVEVGIDVPNATAMVIRDAHRFGLAQLHQFRGRVGRGGHQAYCVLLSDSESDDARERLEAVISSEDGFRLAEEDLRLRGPGEFWGTRQSGLPELKVAKLGDVATIQLAREAAVKLLEEDRDLSRPRNWALRDRVQSFWSADAVDL